MEDMTMISHTQNNLVLAPIVLFVYNRLSHTQKTIEALQKNLLASESELFIFSDGPKNDAGELKIDALRQYLKTITGFKRIEIIERETNRGLAESVIAGVTQIVNKYGCVIVLEDDLVTSPFFLTYMNDALLMYQNDEQVISIHGYVYPVKEKLPETFFIKGADCWGWATWKRGWDLFERDGKKLLQELQEKKLTKSFDFDGTYAYTLMLKSQTKGFNSSWAIRWYAAAFLANKLTLYPGKSFVQNIGLDNSGTHTGKTKHFDVDLIESPCNLRKIEITENIFARKMFMHYFSSWKMRAIYLSMIFSYVKKSLKKFV